MELVLLSYKIFYLRCFLVQLLLHLVNLRGLGLYKLFVPYLLRSLYITLLLLELRLEVCAYLSLLRCFVFELGSKAGFLYR